MKKMMFLSIMLTGVSCGLWCVAEAAKPESEAVTIQQGELVKVIYSSPNPCEVKITIANEKGDVLLTEKIKGKKEFIRPYNFSLLEEGTYEVTIQDDTGEHVNEVEYKAPKEKDLLAHINYMGKEGDDETLYLIAIPSDGDNEVTITVYDANDQPLHSDSKSITGGYATIYRIIGAREGVSFKIADKEGREKYFEY